MMSIVIAVAVGVCIGILSGLIGVGGGIVLTPILVYGYHMTQHKAQGTSLAMLLLPTGFLAFWKYYKAGNADWKLGLMIAAGVFVGGLFGGQWAQYISDNTLRKIFAACLFVVSLKLFFQR